MLGAGEEAVADLIRDDKRTGAALPPFLRARAFRIEMVLACLAHDKFPVLGDTNPF